MATVNEVGLINYDFEVVSDRPLKLPKGPRLREIVVPSTYRTKTGMLILCKTV